MPLDAMSRDGLVVLPDSVPPPKVKHVYGLHPLLASLGIEPVRASVLIKHKQVERERHPGNFFWRHPDWYAPAVMISMMTAVMSATISAVVYAPGDNLTASLLLIAMIAGLAFIMLSAFTTSRAPAEWRERIVYHFDNIPLPIKQLAQRVQAAGGRTVSFRVGTLYQETKVLDPYLLVMHYDPETYQYEWACLGIWDGRKIIGIAKQIEGPDRLG